MGKLHIGGGEEKKRKTGKKKTSQVKTKSKAEMHTQVVQESRAVTRMPHSCVINSLKF